MNLSIVIVNWNTRELLRGCLNSLSQATAGLTTEILVVDNASNDDSATMVANDFPDVRLLEAGGNLGFSRGNNLALPHTTGDTVLLLNPDTVCPPQSLTRLYRFLHSRQNVGAVGPRLVTGNHQPTISGGYFPRARFHWLGFVDPRRLLFRGAWSERIVFVPQRSETSRRVEYIMGACFMMPRAALDRVGLLDDNYFMYFEETDWCWRAHQLGLDIWFCAETEITHLEGRSAEQASQFSLRQFQRSYRLFVAKNYGSRRVFAFRLAQFAEYGAKCLWRSLLPGSRNKALAAHFATKARLQFANQIAVEPPA